MLIVEKLKGLDMLWTPEREWEDQDAFIIGGGASLRAFDFDLLKGLNTIGCNDAFRLGEEVVKLCMFGDASWFHKTKFELIRFKNPLVTVAPSLERLNTAEIKCLKRSRNGLHSAPNCGWNFSTGGAAVNLALILGAKRVFLLGVDLVLHEGRSHWHDKRMAPTHEQIFARFIKGFKAIHDDLYKYPGREIIHVTLGESRLPFFKQMHLNDFSELIRPKKPEPAPMIMEHAL